MSRFTILDGSERIFSTDDEELFRSFLQIPGANNPALSKEIRERIILLSRQLPVQLPAQVTINEGIGDMQKRLRIVIGHTPWRGAGS